jgi:hypothetical protein
MEHLTGVRISRASLTDAIYRCAAVPNPRSLAWMRANPTRIGPWTVEQLAVQARSRLAAYAADPDRDEDDDQADHDEYEDEDEEWAGWAAADPHRWGERSPNDRLRHVGGNVQGMEQIDLPLVFDLSEAPDTTLRSIAVWAAERAYEAAGLMDLPWTAPAMAALREDRPLPPPFDDPTAVWPHLDTVPITTVRSCDGMHDNVSQQHAAAAAPLAAAEPDALQAALDTLYLTAMTYGDRYPDLLTALRDAFPQLGRP